MVVWTQFLHSTPIECGFVYSYANQSATLSSSRHLALATPDPRHWSLLPSPRFFFAEKSYRPHPVEFRCFAQCHYPLFVSGAIVRAGDVLVRFAELLFNRSRAVSSHVAGGPMSGMAHLNRAERSRTGEHHALVLVRRLADERRDVLRERFGALEHALHAVRFRSASVFHLPMGWLNIFGAPSN